MVVTNYQGHVTVTPITKHYPPDVRACEFWLKNRCPDLWRDRKGDDGGEGEAQSVLQQAAERILAADMEEWQRIMSEEGESVVGITGQQTLTEERKREVADKLRRSRSRAGREQEPNDSAQSEVVEVESVEVAQVTAEAPQQPQNEACAEDEAVLPVGALRASLGLPPKRSAAEIREFGRILAQAEKELG